MSATIIEKYKDRFLSYIDARAIVTRLEIDEVIPDTVSHKIQQSAPSVANEVLFLHLRSHSSLETLHKLCDVMIGMSGYPKMNKLGRLMKDDLTTVSCVSESSEHTLMYSVFCAVCSLCIHCVQSRPVHSSHHCMCTCVTHTFIAFMYCGQVYKVVHHTFSEFVI